MKAIVSTLFRVMHFPHDGKIVTIDQLPFVTPDHHIIPSNKNFFNVPNFLLIPSPSSSYLLPIIGKMGGMAPASGLHTRVKFLVSYVRGQPTNLWTSCWLRTCCEHSSHSVSSSLKNETDAFEQSSHSVSSLLKNETDVLNNSYFLFQACVKMKPSL